MQKKALAVVMVLSLAANGTLGYFLFARDALGNRTRYTELKSSYISLATAQKYLFEAMLKSPESFQTLMPEYKDVSKDKFQEGMRRKVVKLEMEIDALQKH